jgi:hypothetical protein
MLRWFKTCRRNQRVARYEATHGSTYTSHGIDVHVLNRILIGLKTHPDVHGNGAAGKQGPSNLIEGAGFEFLGEDRNMHAFRTAVG